MSTPSYPENYKFTIISFSYEYQKPRIYAATRQERKTREAGSWLNKKLKLILNTDIINAYFREDIMQESVVYQKIVKESLEQGR